jgi:hypothetical protein
MPNQYTLHVICSFLYRLGRPFHTILLLLHGILTAVTLFTFLLTVMLQTNLFKLQARGRPFITAPNNLMVQYQSAPYLSSLATNVH